MTITSIPSIFYEFAFNADPNQNTLPPYWTDLSARVQSGWKLVRGRQYELDANETGVWSVELANNDGALDPGNTASPYSPNVLPYRQCRIRVVVGNNLLGPDQASAGEYASLYVGPVPAWLGVVPGAAASLVIASVGASAYQGTQVFAVTVPSGTAAPSTVIQASVPTVTAGQTYTFSIQAQVTTSGQNPTVAAVIDWIGTAGTVLSTSTGTGVGLTGASGTWTQAVVTAAAPAAAVAAALRLSTSTVPSANTVFWTDGLQLEARGYATRWQMPWTPGVNLLPRTIATGTETMAMGDQVATWFYNAGGTLGQTTFLTAAPSGQSTAVAWTLPAGSYGTSPALYVGSNTAYLGGPVADCAQVTAGRTYTGSVYVSRTGSDPTVTVASGINWFDAAGNVLAGSFSGNFTVPTSGWVRVSVIHAAPAGAVWGRMFIYMSSASLAATETIYATGWQFEQASGATAWADPGPATFLFTGMAERWPNTWNELDGTWGTSMVECVDAFAAFAQPRLLSPFLNEVKALASTFAFLLDDPSGSASCVDAGGRRPAAPVENSTAGAGSLTFGNAITSTGAAGSFVGLPGPVATFGNAAATSAATVISLHKTTVTPGPPSGASWTRLLAFRTTTVPGGGNYAILWQADAPSPSSNFSYFQIRLTSTGAVLLGIQDITGTGGPYTSAGSYCDGNWHLVGVSFDTAAGKAYYWIDGAQVALVGSIGAVGGFYTDVLGSGYLADTRASVFGYTGDLAAAVELPLAVTASQMTNLYNSWRTASTGDSSGTRYARILRWVGWTGATAIDAGSTTSMGPATDTLGQSALNALNEVAATENGDQYASSAGVMTFKGRSALYGARTPVAVFGEGRPVGNAGEWPCEIGSIDFDPARLANSVAVTQYQGPTFSPSDAASAQRFFPRQYTRTVNTTLSSEAQDAATYLLSQLKDPRKRADVIRLHPSAIVGLFPVLAQLDKNVRVRMVKRPTGAPATVIDGYTQRISWSCSPESDFFAEYQMSSADLTNYWVLGALHTTLNAQASSGQKLVTINALPDAATNKLAQSLPAAYSLTFEPGTARAETIAIGTGGIPSTSLGYSTATLTMAVNLAFTHPAGSVVCEALPAGYTDPTVWDSSSILGAAYTTVVPGSSGPAQLVVGPLPDAASNSLSLTWGPGTVLWLSPGTVNFETATIQSVGATYPGYALCLITFTATLAHSHSVGDYVCEPLPAGVTNPTAINPTARVAY